MATHPVVAVIAVVVDLVGLLQEVVPRPVVLSIHGAALPLSREDVLKDGGTQGASTAGIGTVPELEEEVDQGRRVGGFFHSWKGERLRYCSHLGARGDIFDRMTFYRARTLKYCAPCRAGSSFRRVLCRLGSN